jgi:hypothetical protein
MFSGRPPIDRRLATEVRTIYAAIPAELRRPLYACGGSPKSAHGLPDSAAATGSTADAIWDQTITGMATGRFTTPEEDATLVALLASARTATVSREHGSTSTRVAGTPRVHSRTETARFGPNHP